MSLFVEALSRLKEGDKDIKLRRYERRVKELESITARLREKLRKRDLMLASVRGMRDTHKARINDMKKRAYRQGLRIEMMAPACAERDQLARMIHEARLVARELRHYEMGGHVCVSADDFYRLMDAIG